jgi:hypothetical protein
MTWKEGLPLQKNNGFYFNLKINENKFVLLRYILYICIVIEIRY